MKPEKRNYPFMVAVCAMVLTAIAISASIVFALRMPPKTSVHSDYRPMSSPVLADNSFDRNGDFTTPFGTFTPIEHVLDINEYMTRKPVLLTEEETDYYITYDGSDCYEIMDRIQKLSDDICLDLDNDIDKAYEIAMWVGKNLIYDYDAAETNADISVTSLQAIFENDYRTTCGGFSNMYSALCSAQGIYCLNMKGGASAKGFNRSDLETIPANHEWNAICINDKWYFADCTWISDKGYSDGEITGGEKVTEFYTMFNFGQMSIEHRIDRCEHREYRKS